MEDKAARLEFLGIRKSFPGVVALDDVSFSVQSGEVTALVGENGAGKSTLLKILSGDYSADQGEILVNAEKVAFRHPSDAIEAGIGVIYQERHVVPFLTVAENLFMEELPLNRFGFIDFPRLNRAAQSIIDEFDLPIRATQRVNRLSVAHQQMVEIMKAYRRNPHIIAFDEPTASLSDHEIAALFRIIRQLKERGLIVLYVSHRIKEIFEVCDRIVVLKDGRLVNVVPTKETNERELIRQMVGRDLGDVFSSLPRHHQVGEVLLEVAHLKSRDLNDVSFCLRAGEILGFAGLVGAGRTEVVRAIYGADRYDSGEIRVKGEPFSFKSPFAAIEQGIAMCPEDRKDEGIIGRHSVKDNINLTRRQQQKKNWLIREAAERELAESSVRELSIITPTIDKIIQDLSGGNQQKVLLARSLAIHPGILILDEPTKGIDVGAKSEIYRLIVELAAQGIGIVFISSELPELIGLADRILVMCQGRITGELTREQATEEEILYLAMLDMLEDETSA